MATAALRPDPDLVIIGVKRGGTTSLFRDLERHPSMCAMVPSARRLPLRENMKGAHWLDSDLARSPRWYRSHFATSATKRWRTHRTGTAFTAEASPYYFFHPLAAKRAAMLLPRTRFVVMLRDPVERTVSHWAEQTRNGVETLTLRDALAAERDRVGDTGARLAAGTMGSSHAHEQQSYAAQSEYAASLGRWIEAVGSERVIVVFSEDYYADPQRVIGDVLSAAGQPAMPTDHESELAQCRTSAIHARCRHRCRTHRALPSRRASTRGSIRSHPALGPVHHRRTLTIMRILQLHARYRIRAGEDTVVDNEAAALIRAGHDVEQLTLDNPTERAATIAALAHSVHNRASARLVRERIAAARPDVVHVHNTWFASVIVSGFCRRRHRCTGRDDIAQLPTRLPQHGPVPRRSGVHGLRRPGPAARSAPWVLSRLPIVVGPASNRGDDHAAAGSARRCRHPVRGTFELHGRPTCGHRRPCRAHRRETPLRRGPRSSRCCSVGIGRHRRRRTIGPGQRHRHPARCLGVSGHLATRRPAADRHR